VASFVPSRVSARFGRKRTMQAASVFFLAGSALCAGAADLAMLIVGRVCLGVGVGFGNQAAPLFLSEIAPAQHPVPSQRHHRHPHRQRGQLLLSQ
jgi:MFS transporter, SP family, sugar:H+ symporter